MLQEKELLKKKIGVLRTMAKGFEPPIELKPTWTKKKIARLIIKRQGSNQVRKKQQPANQPPAEQQAPGPAPGPAAPNIGFEKAATVTEPPIEKRGGVREGAGRPMGMTDEKAKVKNLPKYPSIPIKQGVQALFDLWASFAKIEQLALSEPEADLLSLPLTQLQEYYFPGILPEIAGAWIMFIFAFTRVIKPRIDLIDVVRKQRRSAQQTRAGAVRPKGEILHYKADDGGPLHAMPPGEAVVFTDDIAKVNCPVCRDMISKAN